MSRLSWRKQPNETGLRSIGQAPRGLEMRYVGEVIGSVSALVRNRFEIVGWYFTARSDNYGVPLYNSYSEKHYKTKELAKDACDEYVRKHFKAKP